MRDDKDWTWVLSRPCPDCGFDAGATDQAEVATLTRAAANRFLAVLQRPDVTVRPAPDVWSPLEYACHVRDVCRIFDERLGLMLAEDDPIFANWDQDETALAQQYGRQDPAVVAGELETDAARIADRFAAVVADQWQRPSRRSNGSRFTTESFSRYFLHDLVHHLHDVRG